MAENAVADGAQTVAPTQSGAGEGQSAGGSILAELEAPDSAAAEATPDPWGDPEFLKKLETMDFSKAPEQLRRKIEAPFVAHSTKGWQEIAEQKRQLQAEKDRIFNVAIERLRGAGVETPSPTVQDQIRERLEAGDMNALPDLVKQEIEREVGPIRQQQAFQKAITTAFQMNPLVREREPEIAAMLQQDETLGAMAKADNFRYAPYVLAGLADRIEKANLQQQIETLKASFDAEKKAYARRAIEELRAQGATLPPVTSKAGSSAPGSRNEGFSNGGDAIRAAFVAAGGKLDPQL